MTVCSAAKLCLEGVGRRRVEADFSAEAISSDGGGLLLREVDVRLRLSERLAECFTDHRSALSIEHSVRELVAQRVLGLALGYEDLNDHAELSRDPLLAALVGKKDPGGRSRRRPRHRGQALASPSTLGRLERTRAEASAQSRYAKIVCDFEKLGRLFVQLFLETMEGELGHAPSQLILDIDPSDVALHGEQERRFYHGYYDHYCYLPMYVFCGPFPLAVRLRPSNLDGSLGTESMLAPIVAQLRARWPEVKILVRADSGFCRESILAWCERERVDYVIGLAKNARLTKVLAPRMERARRASLRGDEKRRFFSRFRYRTHKTWSRSRWVVGKAEYTHGEPNPRFLVTSLPAAQFENRYLYEELYCQRGESENRIKEQQLDLFGDRVSGHTFRTNHIRLWMSMAAHWLIVGLRHLALKGTELAHAQAATLRVRLLKIGACVRVSARRLYVRLSRAFPRQGLFRLAVQRLREAPG